MRRASTGGGRIINLSTVSAHTPMGFMVDYNSAKAALLAFTKTMSFELAADKILVNSVCPALIHSPLWARSADSMVPAMGNSREEVYQNLANQLAAPTVWAGSGGVWPGRVPRLRAGIVHNRQPLQRRWRLEQIDLGAEAAGRRRGRVCGELLIFDTNQQFATRRRARNWRPSAAAIVVPAAAAIQVTR